MSNLKLCLAVTAAGALALAGGCRDTDNLRELDVRYPVEQDPAYVELNTCAQKADVIKTRTKYIFVIDKSGSNEQNFRLNPDGSIALPLEILPTLATDRDGSRRYAQLLEFLANSPASDPDRFYSLVNFSTNASTVRGFTSDRASFRTTVQSQLTNLNDEGSTNYLGALTQVHQLISADIQAAITAAASDPSKKVSSTYLVVFISDGFPVISIDTAQTPPLVTAQKPAEVLQKVRDLLTLQTDNAQYVDSVNVFTGYYYVTGNQDDAARQLLDDMARTGHGVPYTFGGADPIDFSVFQVPQKTIKYSLADVFVSNRSVVWHNGEQALDSDRDGLPDALETRLGSDPAKRDSDGNGVSDFVEYRSSPNAQPCASLLAGRCQSAGARSYVTILPAVGGCSTLTNWARVNGIVSFPDTDKDSLNDCEELVLGNAAGLLDFDANGDLIPDGLQFRNELEFTAGSHTALNDPDEDGMTNYAEIKFGMPPQMPNFQILMAKPLEYDLRIVSSTATQDCYSLRVMNMPTVGDSNVIRVELVESTNEVVNRRIYRVAEKAYAGASKVLVFNDPPLEPTGVWR